VFRLHRCPPWCELKSLLPGGNVDGRSAGSSKARAEIRDRAENSLAKAHAIHRLASLRVNRFRVSGLFERAHLPQEVHAALVVRARWRRGNIARGRGLEDARRNRRRYRRCRRCRRTSRCWSRAGNLADNGLRQAKAAGKNQAVGMIPSRQDMDSAVSPGVNPNRFPAQARVIAAAR
jgi:hypothetical protein